MSFVALHEQHLPPSLAHTSRLVWSEIWREPKPFFSAIFLAVDFSTISTASESTKKEASFNSLRSSERLLSSIRSLNAVSLTDGILPSCSDAISHSKIKHFPALSLSP